MMPMTPSILVVRPDHLGDTLLTLPAVVALRRALPDASIHVLVPPGSADVPRHCPAVDTTITVPFPPLERILNATDWPRIAAREAAALHGRFDLAILPRPDDPWSGALVASAGTPIRFGFATPRTEPFLTDALSVPPNTHVTRLALQMAAAAGRRLGGHVPSDPGFESSVFVTTNDEEAEAERALLRAGEHSRMQPVVLHPGSGWPVKNWLAARWGALAAALHERIGARSLVTGSAAERDLVDAVVMYSGGSAHSLSGDLSLGGLAALQRRARVVVATDSGPLHLAALVGAPVVGLYGPAGPEIFGPWCPPRHRRVVRVSLACSPCNNLLDPPCGAMVDPACVTGVSVDAVVDAVEDLLASNQR